MGRISQSVEAMQRSAGEPPKLDQTHRNGDHPAPRGPFGGLARCGSLSGHRVRKGRAMAFLRGKGAGARRGVPGGGFAALAAATALIAALALPGAASAKEVE